MSDAKLRAKVALQQAGVIGTPPSVPASPPSPAPAAAPAANGEGRRDGQAAAAHNDAPAMGSQIAAAAADHQAAANLARDARAAWNAPTAVVENGETLVARALQEPETRVSDEGANLLKGTRAE